MQTFELNGLMRRCFVERESYYTGWRVILFIAASSDDLWERLTHFAMFESDLDAERLCARIRQRGKIDLNCWTWTPSQASPFKALQQPSKAIMEHSPRPSSNRGLAR